MSTGTGAVKESAVTVQMRALAESINNIVDQIGQLEGRLSRVVRQEPPATTDEDKSPEEEVPLANELRVFHHKLTHAHKQLNSILSRLEV